MRQPKVIRTGIVRATLTSPHGSSKLTPSRAKESIYLIGGRGVENDRHARQGFLKSGVRERKAWGIPDDTRVINWREFSAVSVEELQSIAVNLDLPGEIPYGSLVENLVIAGIPGFSQLPGGTLLCFTGPGGQQRSAMLMVLRANVPCGNPGGIIQELYQDVPDVAKRFAAEDGAAEGLRGVVGIVFASGIIFPGDTVTAFA